MRLRFALVATLALVACKGEHWGPGQVTERRIPADVVAGREARQRETTEVIAPEAADKQILFGDLHVHTTFSPDAFIMSLPLMGGEGAHPPADACDFARFCSGLDFWSVNDHAEGVTPQRWQETKESIRQCNAVAGDSANPDTVAFLGWEWSQVNLDRNKHYGHKNVILRDTAEEDVPRRAIAAPREQLGASPMGPVAVAMLQLADWENRDIYRAVPTYYEEIAQTPICEKGIDTRNLPDDCLETADDPEELFEKLDQWGFDSIVIPHGNAWGLNTPPGTSFDKQLNARHHDPDRQILFEVFSGHGNSEEYRDWRSADIAADGSVSCPAPSKGYEPCCWRAGEIIRSRCEDPGSSECEGRVATARQNHVEAGVTGYWTVPGTKVEDWLECGQCTDCFLPTFDQRPMATAQYAYAISNFNEPESPLRYRFGMIGSSDVHSGRPGTGYKEFARMQMTEASGPIREELGNQFGDDRDPTPLSVRYDHAADPLPLSKLRHMERQSSFYVTGGLVATHADGRDRGAIWNALAAREVYATSGDRILLWFDLLEPDGSTRPMGSEVATDEAPRFRVRAAGAFEQQPGCPDSSVDALDPERLARLCRGECHHPGERRRLITHIEVVRIRPQAHPGEAVGDLVEDPWRSFECPLDRAGCTVEFEDDAYPEEGRDVLYYVRAIQEPTPTVNGDNLRCERDAEGRCIAVAPCHGDYRTPASDDCLADSEERAWSSPIFLSPPAS